MRAEVGSIPCGLQPDCNSAVDPRRHTWDVGRVTRPTAFTPTDHRGIAGQAAGRYRWLERFGYDFSDLVQEAQLGMLRSAKAFDSIRGAPSTWAWWTARRALWRLARRVERQLPLVAAVDTEETPGPADEGPLPDRVAMDKELLQHVQEAARELSPADQKLLRARLDGATQGQLAKDGGLSRQAINLREKRMLRRLSRRLNLRWRAF